ncbi:mechanosensitive ion channel [Fragilaria crotonensis]|nr:mechanosensitive ion channel [Fragilaria crotonensis]
MGLFNHHTKESPTTVQDVIVSHVEETMIEQQHVDLHGRLSLAGKIRPHLSKLYIHPEKLRRIWQELIYAIDVEDVIFLIVLSLFSVQIGRLFYRVFEKDISSSTKADELAGSQSQHSQCSKKVPENVFQTRAHTSKELNDDYYDSVTYSIATLIQQLARLAVLVFWFDCTLIALQVMGYSFEAMRDPSGDFARCLFTTWGCFKLMHLKRYLLGEAIECKPDNLGKAVVFDRVVDVLIYLALGLSIMDTINFQIGPGLASLFAFGGLGTFVFGMASRDMAAQIVSGIAVTTSERFHVGEDIQLRDSTRGVVEAMGWFYTDLRGADEIVIKIPNNELANQRISNFSRMDKCQVKVNLRISYADHAKITKFCTELKSELVKECEHLILDGSRPFRANWRGFESDHLLVVVDTHHYRKPTGDEFYENQELVLKTIARVAEEVGVTFAMPRYDVHKAHDKHHAVYREGQLA